MGHPAPYDLVDQVKEVSGLWWILPVLEPVFEDGRDAWPRVP